MFVCSFVRSLARSLVRSFVRSVRLFSSFVTYLFISITEENISISMETGNICDISITSLSKKSIS